MLTPKTNRSRQICANYDSLILPVVVHLLNLVFDQVMQPSLEDLQQSLNKACQLVVDVSKGVHQWGQKTTGIMIHGSSAADTPVMLPGLGGKDRMMIDIWLCAYEYVLCHFTISQQNS